MGHISVLIAISIVLLYLGRKMKQWDDRKYLLAAFVSAVQTVLILYAMWRMPWPS